VIGHIRRMIANPKTTVAGLLSVLSALGVIVNLAVQDWHYLFVADYMSAPLMGLIAGVGLLQAADQSDANAAQIGLNMERLDRHRADIDANTTQIAAGTEGGQTGAPK
jgi:hypothetical protein